MRILFMGTPDIAASCLSALIEEGHDIVGAVCQPDRPRGRGHHMMKPPVKVLAEERGIPVFQPETLKNGAFDDTVRMLAPDISVVVAYGKILPASVLFAPRLGSINVHASLLPRYRGAAPMQRALMDGVSETGVTIMHMDEGLDTGDMIIREVIPLDGTENFEVLHDKTAAVGSRLLCRAIAMLAANEAPREKQPEQGASYAAKITREDCILDFSLSACELERRIRALSPMPLALTALPNGRLIKISSARVVDVDTVNEKEKCGLVASLGDRGEGEIVVLCAKGALALLSLRPEGKGTMSAAEFVRGRSLSVGDTLSAPASLLEGERR